MLDAQQDVLTDDVTRATFPVEGQIDVYPERGIVEIVLTAENGSRIGMPFTLDQASGLVEALTVAILRVEECRARQERAGVRGQDPQEEGSR